MSHLSTVIAESGENIRSQELVFILVRDPIDKYIYIYKGNLEKEGSIWGESSNGRRGHHHHRRECGRRQPGGAVEQQPRVHSSI